MPCLNGHWATSYARTRPTHAVYAAGGPPGASRCMRRQCASARHAGPARRARVLRPRCPPRVCGRLCGSGRKFGARPPVISPGYNGLGAHCGRWVGATAGTKRLTKADGTERPADVHAWRLPKRRRTGRRGPRGRGRASGAGWRRQGAIRSRARCAPRNLWPPTPSGNPAKSPLSRVARTRAAVAPDPPQAATLLTPCCRPCRGNRGMRTHPSPPAAPPRFRRASRGGGRAARRVPAASRPPSSA